MQRLLSNRTALLSEDAAKKFNDLWTNSIDREQRQNLYRYWLCKYVQFLTGVWLFFYKRSTENKELRIILYPFVSAEWYRLNEQYDENHQSMQELWLANDQLYMDKAFM